jgi:hypothetical protein
VCLLLSPRQPWTSLLLPRQQWVQSCGLLLCVPEMEGAQEVLPMAAAAASSAVGRWQFKAAECVEGEELAAGLWHAVGAPAALDPAWVPILLLSSRAWQHGRQHAGCWPVEAGAQVC